MGSRTGLKAVTGNKAVFDEIEEVPDQSLIDLAMERLSHVENPVVHRLSVPSLPSWGIDSFFTKTDQNYWHLICPGCGQYNNMSESFPQIFLETGGRTIRACLKCQHELDLDKGAWLPKCPGSQLRGYHISQTFSKFIKPESLLQTYRIGKNLTTFYNDKLGLPYADAESQLTIQDVLSLCGSAGIADSDPGPCFLGCDQGADLHVTVMRRKPKAQLLFLGVLKEWDQLDPLMRRFNISRAVIDGLPDQRGARSFANRFRGRVFMCFYRDGMKGRYRWDERDLTVAADRTESLDASASWITRKEVVLPRDSELMQTFARHMHSTAKKLITDPETGSQKYSYLKLGDDHFRHSFSYAVMALEYGAASFFGQSDLS